MPICYLALGGNVGDVFETMQRGLTLLDRAPFVCVGDVSPAYETAPVGAAAGAPYQNAAAKLECECAPLVLLDELQSIEEQLGRTREGRWSPRPLDLDLLLFGEMVFAEPILTVPHPHLWYRRFVLDPLSDIAAEVVHPLLGVTIRDLRARLLQRPLRVQLAGGDARRRSALAEHLHRRFPDVPVTSESAEAHGTSAATITLDLAEGPGGSTRRRREFTVRDLVESARGRVVHLADLPGTMFEAAESVLMAAWDQPVRHKRPLRRMP
ncbi:MAG: 2-amino-4-hydroxy-6-hydroxymethyldihydropteridine diphosphokinase [Planctomycetaceae bacterium]